jgi:hypothetical protein
LNFSEEGEGSGQVRGIYGCEKKNWDLKGSKLGIKLGREGHWGLLWEDMDEIEGMGILERWVAEVRQKRNNCNLGSEMV